jgi:hypothetical protein
VQRGLDLPVVVIGGWTVVSSLTFSGPTLLWLILLEAAAMAGLALIGLILHEAVMESAVARRPLTALETVSRDGEAHRAPVGMAGGQR